ncbi:Ent-kaurene oxidase [Leucoagaricus sp. SymC.cos]|nr:Ent-kaurene oxidase [Leucoagaricus sp. SymC.cos]
MSLFPLADMDVSSSALRIFSILGAAYGVWKYIEAKRSPLNAIPTIGYSGVLTSYITAVQWLFKGLELLEEGYTRYPDQPFKIAAMSKWVVVLSGKQSINDIRRAPDETLSLVEAIGETIQTKFTFGPVDMHPHHEVTIRTGVTRNIVAKFGEIRDEITESFNEYLPLTEEWLTVPVYETIMHIICRTINRFFVGAPLCREPEFRSLLEQYTYDVIISAKIINCFPGFLKPFVGKYMTKVPKRTAQAMKYLGPMIEERIAKIEQYGRDDPDLPNDVITWLLDSATHDYHRSKEDIVMRILLMNFAAIHTTTMSLTQVLYDLAIHPEYADEMREEAIKAVEEHGWSKVAMTKMRKVDSFMKEALRLNPSGAYLMTRITLKDWTTSDGTVIPAGTLVGIAAAAMNRNEASFPEADKFRGFRFAEMRKGDGELDSIRHQMVSLETDQIVFGHGRHACPGRFLAVNEIKAMFAHILMNYDVQLESGSKERPPNLAIEASIIPNQKAKMMFRKKKVA